MLILICSKLFLDFAMNPLIINLIIAGFAALVSVALGWVIWGRGLIAARHLAKHEQGRFEVAISELAAAQAQLKHSDALRDEHHALVHAHSAVREQLVRVETDAAARQHALEAQIAQLNDVRKALDTTFAALAEKALGQSRDNFMVLANETFTKHREGNQAALQALLNPVQDTLKRYETSLGDIEKNRTDAYASLRTQITHMTESQIQVRDQATKLAGVLRSSAKVRGNWGEHQLRNVLEMAGLSAYADYQTEVSVDSEDGRYRPDVVIRMPGGRSLIIDAKTPLAAYQDAAECNDDETRQLHLHAYARSMKARVDELAGKKYWEKFEDTPDFVVMFVPGEHFVHAVWEIDPKLNEYAMQKKVVIATPTNLIAIARSVALILRQEKLAETAQQVSRLGKELYGRLSTLGDHVGSVGKSLQSAVTHYNKMLGSLENSVLPSARKFTELDLEGASVPLPELVRVDIAVREPVKLVYERSG